jgi:hypothetical protein
MSNIASKRAIELNRSNQGGGAGSRLLREADRGSRFHTASTQSSHWDEAAAYQRANLMTSLEPIPGVT